MKKIRLFEKVILLFLFISLIFVACAGTVIKGKSSIEGPWLVDYVKGQDSVESPLDPLAYFNIKKEDEGYNLAGYGGVNQIGTPVLIKGSSWKAGPIRATRMAGPYLEYESLLLTALESADKFIIKKETLSLYEGSNLLLQAKREDS